MIIYVWILCLARLVGSSHVQDTLYFLEPPLLVAPYLVYDLIGGTSHTVIRDCIEQSMGSG